MNDLVNIARQFSSSVKEISSFGNGNINDTFIATTDEANSERFILQRINTRVFQHPQRVMQNMCVFTRHVCDRLQCTPCDRRWETPKIVLTQTQQNHYVDAAGSFWRAISFIEGAASFETMHDTNQAQEIGYALGMFHNLISDLPPERLTDTLVGFHITPLYLQQFQAVEKAVEKTVIASTPEVKYGIQFIRDRQTWAHVLEDAKAQGKLPLRLMHGDPKVNNVMFDSVTGKAVSMIDLDTVKPGLIHYDIGDCLRSGCNPTGEETEEWGSVQFDPDLCQAILKGYLSVANEFLTENDYTYLYDSIRLIAFELGLRFFTDYLAGNVYFKVKYPEHNLIRALVQFKLTERIESQEATIRTIIQDLK